VVARQPHETVDVYYDIAADGLRMEINTRPTVPDQERWRFYLMRVRRARTPRDPCLSLRVPVQA